jgi:hypothetical protein
MAMHHQAPPTFKEKPIMGEQREKICKEIRQRWDRLCFNNRVDNVYGAKVWCGVSSACLYLRRGSVTPCIESDAKHMYRRASLEELHQASQRNSSSSPSMIIIYDQRSEPLTQGCDLQQIAVFQVYDPIEIDGYAGEVERREIMDILEGKHGTFQVLVDKSHKIQGRDVGYGQMHSHLASTRFLQRHQE